MKMDLTFSNSTSSPRSFQLEPWGGLYTIAPRGELKIVIDAPSIPVIEVEFQADMPLVIVHGPARADAIVYDGERQVRAR